jgi:hypothetical protein
VDDLYQPASGVTMHKFLPAVNIFSVLPEDNNQLHLKYRFQRIEMECPGSAYIKKNHGADENIFDISVKARYIVFS